LMVRDTVAVETRARFAISRISMLFWAEPNVAGPLQEKR
jgi:hypothetical protein